MTNFTLIKKTGEKIILCEKSANILNGRTISITKKKYARLWIGKKNILFHRLLLQPLENEQVDHINLNKLDNRFENLRICNRSGNSANRLKLKNKKIKYKGVSIRTGAHNRKKIFLSRIRVDNKLIYIGLFYTQEAAAKAYDETAIKFFREFAKTNKMLGLLGEENATI